MDAHAWDQRYAASELVWSVTPNQFVEREASGLPPGRALDLAAGEGRNAIWLAQQGWDVTALDFSAVAIEKGRQLAAGLPVEWKVADATTWLPSAVYDLSVIAYLQLPAAERAAATRTAYDALAHGGTFLLVAHDITNLAEGTGGPQDASVLMSADDVLSDLAGRDFRVVHADRVPRVVSQDDGHGSMVDATAWDCLVRLVKA